MREYRTKGRVIFQIFNYTVLVLLMLVCLVPIVHILAKSFSSAAYVNSNLVSLWPKGWTTAAYRYVMSNGKFWQSFFVTFQRILLGVPINVILTVLAAYPLSKEENAFRARKFYVWIFLFVMIFNAGLIPTYLLVQQLGLIDTVWALVLPSGVGVFNVVLMMNFFRGIPKEIEESALVDGANQGTILLRLYLPLAKPSIATITLFSFMGHWNSWMEGRIYMNNSVNYPLQTYLQSILESADSTVMNMSNLDAMVDKMLVSGQNLRAAMLFISIVPVLVVYPFLQKYFTTGLVMGSVKG